MMSWPGRATGTCLCTAAWGRLLPATCMGTGMETSGALAGWLGMAADGCCVPTGREVGAAASAAYGTCVQQLAGEGLQHEFGEEGPVAGAGLEQGLQ